MRWSNFNFIFVRSLLHYFHPPNTISQYFTSYLLFYRNYKSISCKPRRNLLTVVNKPGLKIALFVTGPTNRYSCLPVLTTPALNVLPCITSKELLSNPTFNLTRDKFTGVKYALSQLRLMERVFKSWTNTWRKSWKTGAEKTRISLWQELNQSRTIPVFAAIVLKNLPNSTMILCPFPWKCTGLSIDPKTSQQGNIFNLSSLRSFCKAASIVLLKLLHKKSYKKSEAWKNLTPFWNMQQVATSIQMSTRHTTALIV